MNGFDLSRPRAVLIVGVGGPGMSAIAIALAEMGHRVRGTDIKETEFLERVRRAGVDVRIGHDARHVDDMEVVAVSTAIGESNPEALAARLRGVPVLARANILAAIVDQARGIGVAGTHGKTTTTSLLTLILREAGFDPSFIVGGHVHELGTGAAWTGAEWIVVEADESDDSFRALPLEASVLTNVEADHLEHWGSFAALVDGFRDYLSRLKGPVVVCADDPIAAGLGTEVGAITYGTADDAVYRIVDRVPNGDAQRFSLLHRGSLLGPVSVPLRGAHMAANACAAIAMALELGASFAAAARAVERFRGVARRFEFRGESGGATLVDDYAHLPGEIAAVLNAARTSGDDWSRVVAVFQPNRYRRMALMSDEYRDAFVDADVVVLTDIYPSGDAPIAGVTGKLVVNAVLDAHPSTTLAYLPRRAELAAFVASRLRRGDLCISMGCGDIASLPDEVMAARANLADR
ncbi:MAG: UDP-N-acetylmuramate--L-alanine ligase [Acidimicrobiales bacterium]